MISNPRSVDDPSGTVDANDELGPPDRSKRRLLLVLVLCVAVALSLLQTGWGRTLWAAAGLAPQPSRYLELFFTYPGGHPTQIGATGGLVQVAFVIRSHDLAVNDQGWTISVSDGRTSTRAATGQVSLQPGEQAEVTRGVVVPCTPGGQSRSSVSVNLDGTSQQILFWLTCTGTAASASPVPSPRSS